VISANRVQKMPFRSNCEWPSVYRSPLASAPAPMSGRAFDLRPRLDRFYTAHIGYDVRHRVPALGNGGWVVNPKSLRRLLRETGREALYRKPRTTLPRPQAGLYP
jgi:putative transposase